METTDNLTTIATVLMSNVEYYLVERVIEAVVLAIICIVAVTGNIMLWLVIFRRKSLRTSSNALILCLSCADLLVALVNMPFTIYTILKGDWIFGQILCTFFGTLNMVTFISSVMSLAAIGINRYIFIVHAKKFREVYTKRNTALYVAGVWIFSCALASPPLMGWASYGYLEGQSFCFCEWSKSITYTFFMVGVCFGGPCTVMTYCYYKILRAFKESQRNVSQNSPMKPNYKRRGSLALDNPDGNSDDRTLSTKLSCGTYVNGSGGKLASTSMIREKRPLAVSFQPLNTPTSKLVSSNTNNASQTSSSDDVIKKEQGSSHAASHEYTKQDTSLDLRQSKQWKCPLKKSKVRDNSLNSRGMLSDVSSTEDFSNPFANSISVGEIAAQAKQNGHKRHVPPGLFGTANGPSASRISRKKKRKEEEMRLTKSFMVVIFVFILCWFPFCITMFWSVFIKDNRNMVPRAIDITSLLLGFANSCCNPIIYGVMNRKFRTGFKTFLCSWKGDNNVSPWKPPGQTP